MKRKLLWIALALLAACQVATADVEVAYPPLLKPAAQEAEAAHLAAEVLSRYHYKATPVDDALSNKMFDEYLKALDPEKLYFLQADIDRLGLARTRLDDAILGEDLRAPFDIFNLYERRAAERMGYARSLLAKGFDFQTDDSLQIERKDQPWPSTEAQLHELWRQRVKNDWLRLKLAGKPDAGIVQVLDKRYAGVAKRLGKVTSADAFQAFMNAFTTVIEPHTNYLGPRAAQDFDIAMRLSLVGIGAVLIDIDGYATIRELVAGGPASQSGQLRVGDRIAGVAQGPSGPMEDVVGWRLDDTVALIRGAVSTTVRLDILPASKGPDAVNKTVSLVRDTIKMQDRAAKAKVYTVTQGKNSRRVGVITLPSFYEDAEALQKGDADYRSASRDVARLLQDMRAQQVDGLVLDLRNNGGGSLREAIDLSGLFIGKVPVVQTRNAQGGITVESNTRADRAWDGPMAVLINRASASASEIFAAAIQDYGRGLIIGDTSFGKGTVQTVASLDQIAHNTKPTFGELKMTIAQFFRVNGGTTQLRGVTPDISFPKTGDDTLYGESTYDNALPWSQIPAAHFRPQGEVTTQLPTLQAQHDSRMASDPGIQRLLTDLSRAQAQREKNVLSLNEAVRKQEREAQEKRLTALLVGTGPGTAQAAASALADDGLQANERNIGKDLAAEKSRDAVKDVLLDEAISILSDSVALTQGQPLRVASGAAAAPLVVTAVPGDSTPK